MLADAYDQVKKNAWRVEDRATIERNLRLSIDENKHALDLAPYDEIARNEMERHRRQLDEFLHPSKQGPEPGGRQGSCPSP